MVANKPKKLEKRYIVYAIVFSVIGVLALLTIAVSAIGGLSDRLYAEKTGNMQVDQENHYNTKKLFFCYDRDIKPCNDEGITTWNEAHADDTFELKDWMQISEQVRRSAELQQRYIFTGK